MPPTGTGGRTTGGWAFDGQPDTLDDSAVQSSDPQRGCSCISPGSVVDTRRHESQVILKITRVMTSPTTGSARGSPNATRTALTTTPSETNASVRAWLPSATRAGLDSRCPAHNLTCAASSL